MTDNKARVFTYLTPEQKKHVDEEGAWIIWIAEDEDYETLFQSPDFETVQKYAYKNKDVYQISHYTTTLESNVKTVRYV